MLAIMMLIASEMMLFSGLIGSFLIFRLQAPFWPPPALPRLPIAVTWVNTFVLLSSALTMTLALRAVHRSRQRLLRRYLLATLALGVTFLAVQGGEWVRLVAHGLKLSSGMYGGTFYLLIGCHGAHVTAGSFGSRGWRWPRWAAGTTLVTPAGLRSAPCTGISSAGLAAAVWTRISDVALCVGKTWQ